MKITESQFNKVLDAYKEADTHIEGVDEMRAELNKLNVEIVPDPETIAINGVEIPAPVRVAPENGTGYFAIDLSSKAMLVSQRWCNDTVDQRYLDRGLLYLNREACLTAADTILNALRKQP